jgi:hypothetical protein
MQKELRAQIIDEAELFMITFFEKMIQTNKVHNREREKVRGEI